MICLIRPPALDVLRFATTSISLPLGLAYIAGALEREGYDVRVIDSVGESPQTSTRCYKGYLVGLSIRDIVKRIPKDCNLIGISAIFTHEWPVVVALIDLIKNKFPDIPIMVGGEHVTSLPEFSLLTSKADFIVMGEGEETCIELTKAIFEKLAFDNIYGIGFRSNNLIKINPRRIRNIEIDQIALPAWHHFDISKYTEYGFLGGMDTNKLTIPILATRGCPYQCTYCSSPNMWTTRWIARKPELVVNEMENWIKLYGARNFPFQDLTAIINKNWILEFCDLLIEKNLDISWQLPSGTRSEAIDNEVASKLFQSGMVNMSYAPESGAERARALVKKRVVEENMFNSIKSAVKYKLNVSAFFVLGFPHDTIDDFRNTKNFVNKLAKLGIEDIAIAFYMALPGTELFKVLTKKGKIKLNREYFRHILDSQKLLPSVLYSSNFNKWQLLFWKIQIFIKFYSSKNGNNSLLSFISSLTRGACGLFKRNHKSKLQTVFRNFLDNLGRQLLSFTKKRWITHREEEQLFEKWQEIFESIQNPLQNPNNKIEVSDSYEELANSNYMKILKVEHNSTLTFREIDKTK